MTNHHLKKLLCFTLSTIMVMGLTATTFASEADNSNNTFAVEDISTYTGETFFYNAETGEAIAENGKPFAFEDIAFELPASNTSENGGVANSRSLEFYIVRGGLKKTSGGKFTWWFNTDCPTSPISKPSIKVTAQLQGNFTTGSSFSNVGGEVSHTYNTNAEYGVDYTWTSTAKTGYYRFKYTITDYDNGEIQSRTTGSNLWNRTGHVWDFTFSDGVSGKYLPKPPANYIKGQTSQRPSNLATTYYNTYRNNTGITLNSSLYDVHHIQPLEYGGNNNYSNLIHLPKATHTKVSGWFRGY